MKGIIVDDFNLIIRKNSVNVEDVVKCLSKINNLLWDLKSKLDGSFNLNKIEQFSGQIPEIESKIYAYGNVLSGVLRSYQNQNEKVKYDIKKNMP